MAAAVAVSGASAIASRGQQRQRLRFVLLPPLPRPSPLASVSLGIPAATPSGSSASNALLGMSVFFCVAAQGRHLCVQLSAAGTSGSSPSRGNTRRRQQQPAKRAVQFQRTPPWIRTPDVPSDGLVHPAGTQVYNSRESGSDRTRSVQQAPAAFGNHNNSQQQALRSRFREKAVAGKRRLRRVVLAEPPDPAEYPSELNQKVEDARRLLHRHLPSSSSSAFQLDVVPSPDPLNYRHRINFELSHNNGQVGFLVFDPSRADWVQVDQSPLASMRINRMMHDLPAALARAPARIRDGAYEAQLISNTDGQALVSLRYSRILDDRVDSELADRLAEELACTVILRADRSEQRLVSAPGGSDFLVQVNEVNGRSYPQHFMDYGFFQANVLVNREMQRWAVAQTTPQDGPPSDDLVELFCGNGNFTLPLAQNFRNVLATELNKRGVMAATVCAKAADVRNVRLVKLRADQARRAFPPGHRPGTLFVDPPRDGLDFASLTLAKDFKRVVYISCNPESLARDLDELSSHRVAAACAFDQFPWTDHLELGVRLERK